MDPNANLAEQERILGRARTVRQIRTGQTDYRKITPGLWLSESEGTLDTRGDRARLRELREALAGWLSGPHPGFAPDWSKCPNAARYYGK